MRRFLLLTFAVAASPALHATSFTFATCTLGTTTITSTQHGGETNASCFIPYVVNDMQVGGVEAQTFTPNSISPTQATLRVVANAGAAGGIPSDVPLSTSARADSSLPFVTTGSNRPGLVQFEVSLGYLHQSASGNVGVLLTDGAHRYAFGGSGGPGEPVPPVNCGFQSCEFMGVLPFDLGSPFQVTLLAHAGATTCCGGTEGDSRIAFSLFEANGTTAVPFFVTPEPATIGLLLLGLAACTCFAFKTFH